MVKRPEGYRAPDYAEVVAAARERRARNRDYLDYVGEVRALLRNDVDGLLEALPEKLRAKLERVSVRGFPPFGDVHERIHGLMASNPPRAVVVANSVAKREQERAAREEHSLNGIREALERQQNRMVYSTALKSQLEFGTSWISVFPSAWLVDDAMTRRVGEETAEEYLRRADEKLVSNVPFVLADHDPETVLPFFDDLGRLTSVIVRTIHTVDEIRGGYGYMIGRDFRREIGEPEVSPHDAPATGARHQAHGSGSAMAVEKLFYCDRWTARTWLDGEKQPIEEYEHDLGVVPFMRAVGLTAADRDPGYAWRGIGYYSMPLARQIAQLQVLQDAVALMYAFPTGFMLVNDVGEGELPPLQFEANAINRIRASAVAGPIEFPLNQANMPVDYNIVLARVMQQWQLTSMPDFGQAIGTGLSGYAINSLRAVAESLLGPLYAQAQGQWRGVYDLLRMWVVKYFGEGVRIQGAIEESADGKRHRPILRYGSEDVTRNEIDVDIEEPLPQDTVARDEALRNQVGAGLLSEYRAMEQMGVPNPQVELDRIALERLRKDEAVMGMVAQTAIGLMSERLQGLADGEPPERGALRQVRGQYLGQPGPSPNMGAQPENTRAGVPVNQLGIPNPGGGQPGASQLPMGLGR